MSSKVEYKVDKDKNLFKNGKLICKLKRNIIKIEGEYIGDRFGDIHKIEENGVKYILGILSYLTAFIVVEDFIITGDKYGRLRFSDLEGKILTFLFLEDFVVDLICEGTNCKEKIIYAVCSKKVFLIEEMKVVGSFMLGIKAQRVEKEIENEKVEYYIVGDGQRVKLNPNK